jgi:hypothetical protein
MPTQDGRALRRYRRRWRAERLFAWLHHFRRLVIRWEYNVENFFGMVRLGLHANPVQAFMRPVLVEAKLISSLQNTYAWAPERDLPSVASRFDRYETAEFPSNAVRIGGAKPNLDKSYAKTCKPAVPWG